MMMCLTWWDMNMMTRIPVDELNFLLIYPFQGFPIIFAETHMQTGATQLFTQGSQRWSQAISSLVWGAGQENHLSQSDVQEKGALLLFPLESMRGQVAATVQTTYLSLPWFSCLHCAVVRSAESRFSGSNCASHVTRFAQCGVPRLCFDRHGSPKTMWEVGAHLQCFTGICFKTPYCRRSIQYAKGWSWLSVGTSGAGVMETGFVFFEKLCFKHFQKLDGTRCSNIFKRFVWIPTVVPGGSGCVCCFTILCSWVPFKAGKNLERDVSWG